MVKAVDSVFVGCGFPGKTAGCKEFIMQQNLEQNVLRPVKCLMAFPSTILVFAKMACADIIKGIHGL